MAELLTIKGNMEQLLAIMGELWRTRNYGKIKNNITSADRGNGEEMSR